MARALSEVVSDGRIEDPADASVYGLDSGAIEVGFSAGPSRGRVRLGRQTPVGTSVYAAVVRDLAAAPSTGERAAESEEIHLIGTARAALFDRTAEDLRDRRVLDFEPEQVSKLSLVAADAGADFQIALERREEGWAIVSPAFLPADESAVRRLLSDLSQLRAEAFVDEPDSVLEAALETPDYEVTLGVAASAGDRLVKLRLVRTTLDKAESRHTARGRDGHVYRVSHALVAHLPRRLFALREKKLARFDETRVRRIELRFGGDESIWVERDDAGSPWRSAEGAVAPGPMDELVSSLAHLDAVDVVAEALGADEQAALGLAPARLRIRLMGETAAEGGHLPLAELRFGATFPERGPLVLSGEEGAVLRVHASFDSRLPWDATVFAREFLVDEAQPDEALSDEALSDEPISD